MTDPTTRQPAIDPGDPPDPRRLNRRDALVAGGGALGLFAVGFGVFGSKFVFPHPLVYPLADSASAQPGPLSATPTSGDDDETNEYEEGPFYAPNTPEKTDFRVPGHRGRDLLLRGRVLDTAGVGLAGAVLDFWQANEDGAYDNVGYSYRGHQYTRPDGSYELRTVVPVPYTFAGLWRFPHIHVKVQGPPTRLLTTQLFFDNDPNGYARNVNIDRSLLTAMRSGPGGSAEVTFDFVLPRTR